MRSQRKTVSIIISVFNEENTIKRIIDLVVKSNTLGLEKEIIVIDDGSTDRTSKILQLIKNYNLKVLTNSKNSGKGYSIKKGIIESKGSIVLVQDADLEYMPTNYPKLLEPFISGYADCVYGSRFLSSGPQRVLYFYHYLGNRLVTLFSNFFTNLNMTDMETGYKVFKGDIIRKIAPLLKSNGFGFDPEVTARISKIKGIRIYEVGISYFGRTYSEGKKIGWKDGLLAFLQIIRFNIFS